MLTRKPFDTLLFLKRTLELRLSYSRIGRHIVLDGIAALSEETQRQAIQVVGLYPRVRTQKRVFGLMPKTLVIPDCRLCVCRLVLVKE